MWYITTLLLSLIGTGALASDEPEPTCTCQPTDGYLVTRLWNIVDGDITDQDVIDEFNEGFAPLVTHMDGFQRYTAAKTGNSSTVFFMNAFDTKELAHDAQEAAKEFVNDNDRLNGAITPNQFTEDVIVSYFNAKDCVTTDSAGLFMSTRLYDLPQEVTLDAMVESTSATAVDMKAIDGFVSFASTLQPTNTQGFYFNIYETMEGAVASNNAGTTKADEDPNVVLIEETAGQIAFDYVCAGGKLPDNNEDEKEEKGDDQEDSIPVADPLVGDEPGDTSAAQSHHLGSVLGALMYVWLLLFATEF